MLWLDIGLMPHTYVLFIILKITEKLNEYTMLLFILNFIHSYSLDSRQKSWIQGNLLTFNNRKLLELSKISIKAL
jgi:hypothetical protein